MESFSADDALKLAKGMIRRDAMTPSNGMNRRIVFAASMRGRNDDEAKSALHVHAVLGLPTIRVAACSWKPVRRSCARAPGQHALGRVDRFATCAYTGPSFGSPPDIPLRQERLKNKQRRPRSHLRHKQPSSRRPRRAARVRRRHARPSVPAGRRDLVGQHLPSAPACRLVLVDLRHLSVLRALPPLLAPAGRWDLVGQHLHSAPAGRQVLVDLRRLSVLRALSPLLAPAGRRDLVGQHLPSAPAGRGPAGPC